MSSPNDFDVIVVGGGPIGLSSAYHLSKRRVRTLVLEQFTFVNQLGSSAGISRQFRIPYPEAYMVKLVKQSIPFWDELQSLTSVPLLDKVGTLWFGDPTVHTSEGNIAEAETALKAENVPYTSLNRDALERQYHFTDLPDNYVGLFQEQGASINLKATIETLLHANRSSSHEIPSEYRDFRVFVQECDSDLLRDIDNYLPAGDDWSHLEQALAEIDVDHIVENLEQFMPSYGADDWSDSGHHDFQYEVGRLVERLSTELRQQFARWIRQVPIPTPATTPRRLQAIDPTAFFLTSTTRRHFKSCTASPIRAFFTSTAGPIFLTAILYWDTNGIHSRDRLFIATTSLRWIRGWSRQYHH
jgi:hypothetical protein